MSKSLKTRIPLRTRNCAADLAAHRLRFTVIFHPDVSRIGAFVDLKAWPAEGVINEHQLLKLGRAAPVFSDGQALLEPHVNRAALEIAFPGRSVDISGLSLKLSTPEHSDSRIGKAEARAMVADPAMLKRGVPVRLGHGVVLLLRVISSVVSDDEIARLTGSDSDLPFPGASVEAMSINRQIRAVAATDLPVMILGESGVGKEVVARGIHSCSNRAKKPLVTVNMGAIPESLAAAELFGAVKGSYTGAVQRAGFFREADRGTLFLDEIGDTPESVQVQLLRAVEHGEVQVVGGKPINVDVRLVAATDAAIDTSGDVGGRGEGQFRSALRNRLSGFTINVPPLRERLEDIGIQALSLMTNQSAIHPRYPFSEVGRDTQTAGHWARFFFDLLNREWAGNSRELVHIVSRAMAGDDDVAPVRERSPIQQVAPQASNEVSEDAIYAAYCNSDFEMKAAAAAVGLPRTTMLRRVEAHPDCRVVADLTDQQIRQALASNDDLAAVAKSLGVSSHALRPRIRALSLRD